MTSRWRLTTVALCMLLGTPLAHADIRRWDTGEVIPGTEGILPFPGAQLDHLDLQYAMLDRHNLSGANFEASNLTRAHLDGSNLTDANLMGASLIDADLIGARLNHADLTAANLTGSQLRSARLTDADLTGTMVKGVFFSPDVSKEQLYSTASYQMRNLQGVGFDTNDLTGWNFSGQDLTGAKMSWTNLTDANLSGAVVKWATFAASGLTSEQLYSTASYQAKDLQGIGFWEIITGWDLCDQNLTRASFAVDGSAVDLTDVNLSGAIVTGADFFGTGITNEQLYSTFSYQQKNLHGIYLEANNLTGWDFNGQNLTGADLQGSILTDAAMSGANLKNVNLRSAEGFQSAVFDSNTAYVPWTAFPLGFDPIPEGLTFIPSAIGDIDASGDLDSTDADMLTTRFRPHQGRRRDALPDAAYDLNGDGSVNQEDHRVWVKDLKHIWHGDADLDGEFNSSDMVRVFAAGNYEKEVILDVYRGILNPVSWSEGDWNGDSIFDSSDMVTAFADGGYEKGKRADAAAVPEPGALLLLTMAGACLLLLRTRSGQG